MKIRCIVIDDEPLAIEIIESYIEKIPYVELAGKFSNAIDALQYLKSNKVDLMLLDIQMPELTGIQLMKVLDNPPQVIFTTAYDNYAIKSYELDAVDYLLKPIEFDRFLKAIEKSWKRIERGQSVEVNKVEQTSSKDTFIFIKTEHRVQRVEISEILYIEGMKNYLRVVTRTDKFMTLQNFKSICELLPVNQFMRVHKSFVIAVDKIDSIERSRIRIGKQLIPIGDTYKKDFDQLVKVKQE
ncbi:MAG TPA: response regulator transcription factor [Tenuifilaceae bacterium]|nr:response regulator transcription factor [Tenuifilaceae bacterium]HPI45113.1 response regulator transcription factor [Tenuifilaceae bacterium]HPN21687.1 response regulator transcription factor [Tenuifilaceae bacterium]HPV57860.1 response regulator transcription factor [Tenuifilaceae bacterium]